MRRFTLKIALLVFVLFTSVSQVVFAAGNEPALHATAEVNVNQATAEELAEVLVGVGLKKAQAIVRDRAQNGPFTVVESLSRVKGIGPATIDKNRERIRLD